MKRLLTGTLAATVLVVTLTAGATSAEARHRHWHGWGGAAVGLGAGMIIGSALAQPRYYDPGPAYVYDDEDAPPPVIYRQAPRRSAPNCVSYTKYDYQGRPYEWKDCN